MNQLIIAIDGFSSCGKSTMAKGLAKKLGYIYVDSGAMYRAVSLFCLQQGLIQQGQVDEEGLKRLLPSLSIEFATTDSGNSTTRLNGVDVENAIRSLEVSNVVSTVSALPFVRETLVNLQRKAGAFGGVVMDGRDIGTVVFPQAEVKVFVTADASIRAKRRFDDLLDKGQPTSYEAILDNIRQRDALDQSRAVSPLRQADDAVVLDNGEMTLDEQDAWLMRLIHEKSHGTH